MNKSENNARSIWTCVIMLGLGLGPALPGCRDFIVNAPDSLIPIGSPFVLSGTADVVEEDNGPCLVWLGENGITYHLFQKISLANDLFDVVTTPGTTSRLQLQERTDLDVACQLGPILEVQDVLELIE